MNVFDASAVLAVLNDEPGAPAAMALMGDSDGVISAVNYAEVIGKLVDRGLTEADAIEAWAHLPLTVEPLTSTTALAAGLLRKPTRAQSLSLGDRCCLALAKALGGTVITADKPWKTLRSFDIQLIR